MKIRALDLDEKRCFRPYEKPRIRVIRPKLNQSITTTISSSSPPPKRPTREL
jgi:hypothetical protein